MREWPSRIFVIFSYGVPNYLTKQDLKRFGPIMYSFRVIAWSLTLNFEIFGPFILILAIFFNLKIIFSKWHYSYMFVYIKSHNFVNYNNTRGEGGCKFPKCHFIFRSNFLAKPEQLKYQRYIELKYWTYIFIIWNKTRGYLL